MRVSRFIVLLPALLLCACAGMVPPHEALPGPAQGMIASTDVMVPVSQSEIYVFVPDSQIAAAGGGGLLLALIDAGVNSVRTNKAATSVKPLQDALVSYDFDNALQAQLKTSLAQVPWLHAGNVHVVKEVTNDSLDAALAASRADAVMFTSTDYHLANDGDVLFITVTASLFPNSDALRAQKPVANAKFKTAMGNALYHNILVFKAMVPNPAIPADRDHNIATWSANGGAAMRATLTMGATKLAQMLAADIQGQEGDAGVPANAPTVTIDNVNGQVISSDADGSVVRFKDGTLKYVTK